MKTHFLKFALLLLSSFAMTQCSTSVIEEVVIAETITYTKDVKTIIDNNCVSCHNATDLVAGLDISSFATLQSATENGNVIARINDASSPMPQSGLMDATLIATIEKWVDDGYLEN